MGSLKTEPAKSACIDFDNIAGDVDIPDFILKHSAVLRFPDKLLLLLTLVEREGEKRGLTPAKTCVSWTGDGKAFIIRNREELESNYLPRIFHIHKAKFASFTRKLYRWGFRQVILRAKDDRRTTANNKIFVHEDFQRDNKKLVANMRSITAEATRRACTTFIASSHPAAAASSSPVEYHRRLIEEIDKSSTKRSTISNTSPEPRLDVAMNPTPSATPALASPGNCFSVLPLFPGTVEQQPPVAFSLLSSLESRGGAFNLDFHSPSYPMVPLLHPALQSALLMRRQRQQAEEQHVALAHQLVVALLKEAPHHHNLFP